MNTHRYYQPQVIGIEDWTLIPYLNQYINYRRRQLKQSKGLTAINGLGTSPKMTGRRGPQLPGVSPNVSGVEDLEMILADGALAKFIA